MEDDKVKLNNLSQQEADSVFDAVIAASLRTLFYIIVVGSLLIGSFLMCFPYKSMKISYDLGMYNFAYYNATRAINREKGDRYVDSLIKGIELSDKFLIEEKEERIEKNIKDFSKKEIEYSKSLLDFTQRFALLGQDFDDRNTYLDEFYQNNAISINQKILLYSNKNYVYVQNFKARAILNQADMMLCQGELKQLVDIAKVLDKMNVDDLAIIYNQVLAYCRVDSQHKILFDQDRLNPFYFYISLVDTVENFLLQAKEQSDDLKRLYLVDSAANLEYSIKLLKEFSGIDAIKFDLQIFKIEGLSLEEYINEEIKKLNNKSLV